MTTFNDLKIAEKFSTKVGQYVKTGPDSFYGFLQGEFVESETPMDGDVIPCGTASYLEDMALNHCSELQGIIGTILSGDECDNEPVKVEIDADLALASTNEDVEDMIRGEITKALDNMSTNEDLLSIDSPAKALKTGPTDVGVIVAVTTAMAYCMIRGTETEEDAKARFKKWTDFYPNWTEYLVVTLMYDHPVCPYTLQDFLDAGLTEKDYEEKRPMVHFISFPEEDIVAAE